MRLVTILAFAFACCVARAQYYNPRTVQTFSRPDPAAIARDRAAMAAQDQAKRRAWAEYQAGLGSTAPLRPRSVNVKGTQELRENFRRAKADEAEAAAAAVAALAAQARQRKMDGLIQERAALRSVPIRTSSKEFHDWIVPAVRESRWRILFGVMLGALTTSLVVLFFKTSVRNPDDWRMAAVILGCISIVIGSFSLVGSWIPFLGITTLPASILACALAVIGWGLGRRAIGCETILPQIAIIISLLAITVTLYVHAFLHEVGRTVAIN